MFYDSIIRYEVTAWNDAENPQMPDYQERFNRKADAMKNARQMAKKYNLVEVGTIEVDKNDENNIDIGKLLATWTNHKKTC